MGSRLIFLGSNALRLQTPSKTGEVTVLERQEQKLRPPSMYKVVMLNDDFTPMDFVVDVLQEVFHKNKEAALQIMLKVHNEGRGVCGVYVRDIAATKAEMVHSMAREAGHPLQCIYEPVE